MYWSGVLTGMLLMVVLGVTTCSPMIIGNTEDIDRHCRERLEGK